MHCLVTGATGFIGSRLVRLLLESGHSVRCLVRPGPRVAGLEVLPVDICLGDILDRDAVRRAAAGVDWIFHNAALVHHHSPRKLLRTNLLGMHNLLQACVATGGVDRVVYSSSVAAMGHCRQLPADESHPLIPLTFDTYGRSKLAAERACWRVAREQGVPVSIVRMAGVYGPGSPLFMRGVRFIESGRFFLPGVEALCHFAHVDDVCAALLLAAGSPVARNRTYIVVDDRPVAIRTLLVRIAELLGIRLRVYHLPLGIVRPGVVAVECLDRLLGMDIPITRAIAEYFIRDHVYSARRARQELGWRPHYPDPLEGIRTLTDWYRAGQLDQLRPSY